MDSLNIAGKAVRLCIDNDESRVIEFYPTDVSFAENFYALAAEFEERQNDIKARSAAIAEGDGSKLEKSRAELALTREAFAFLREGIDRTFGPGTAQTVFGSRDSVAMAARFFRGVTPDCYGMRPHSDSPPRYSRPVFPSHIHAASRRFCAGLAVCA